MPRARDLGIVIGSLPTGPTNSVLDVPGVGLGHATVFRDEPAPPEGRGLARTGVTCLVLAEDAFTRLVPAGGAVLNGAGECTGFITAAEWGSAETPVYLTSTLQLGRVYDSACRIELEVNPSTAVDFTIPVVAECDDSYLNDVRIDRRTGTGYITDSGAGGIVVVDLATGRARRTLDGHPSVMAQDGVQVVIEGKPVLDAQGQPPKFNSDGIALSTDGAWLYYQPITATSLFRIRTEVLRDTSASPEAIGAAVERYASTFPVDGLWIDAKDRIYLSDITHTAVSRLLPDRTIERLVVDRRLQWPDTFSEGPDGAIYVTASHINHSATFNRGKSVRKRPYGVFRFMPPS